MYKEFMMKLCIYVGYNKKKMKRLKNYCRDICLMSSIRCEDLRYFCDYSMFLHSVSFSGDVLMFKEEPALAKVKIMRVLCDALILDTGSKLQFCNKDTKYGTECGRRYASEEECMEVFNSIVHGTKQK